MNAVAKDAFDYTYKNYGKDIVNLHQLRMQALEIITRTRAYSSDKSLFQAIDLYVHYCLTGEHQLPEKKE